MDLANFKPNERMIEIMHPGDSSKKLGIQISMMAMSDARMKSLRRRIQDDALQLQARNKNFKSADVEENGRALIVGAMTGWRWYNPTGNAGDDDYDANAMPSFHGETPAFNKQNANAVLAELDWLAQQIAEAVQDEASFFKNSAAS